MPISAPFYSEADLRARADAFLSKYHPARTIPVPIERIVEYRFGIDIVPMPGLQRNFDTAAYITSDLNEIRVDLAVYETRENRYRFSLAHELAHKLLHAEVFEQLSFSTIAEWKASREQIPEREYRFIEWHANLFAALVLVPPVQLNEAFQAAKHAIAGLGWSLDSAPPAAWEWLEDRLARYFCVSGAVIARRGPADDLWEP